MEVENQHDLRKKLVCHRAVCCTSMFLFRRVLARTHACLRVGLRCGLAADRKDLVEAAGTLAMA